MLAVAVRPGFRLARGGLPSCRGSLRTAPLFRLAVDALAVNLAVLARPFRLLQSAVEVFAFLPAPFPLEGRTGADRVLSVLPFTVWVPPLWFPIPFPPIGRFTLFDPLCGQRPGAVGRIAGREPLCFRTGVGRDSILLRTGRAGAEAVCPVL